MISIFIHSPHDICMLKFSPQILVEAQSMWNLYSYSTFILRNHYLVNHSLLKPLLLNVFYALPIQKKNHCCWGFPRLGQNLIWPDWTKSWRIFKYSSCFYNEAWIDTDKADMTDMQKKPGRKHDLENSDNFNRIDLLKKIWGSQSFVMYNNPYFLCNQSSVSECLLFPESFWDACRPKFI